MKVPVRMTAVPPLLHGATVAMDALELHVKSLRQQCWGVASHTELQMELLDLTHVPNLLVSIVTCTVMRFDVASCDEP